MPEAEEPSTTSRRAFVAFAFAPWLAALPAPAARAQEPPPAGKVAIVVDERLWLAFCGATAALEGL